MRLFILPHTIVGIVLILILPARLWLQHFGTPISATVGQITSTHSSKGGDTYHLQYRYKLNGRQVSDQQQIRSSERGNFAPGQTFPGRAIVVAGHDFSVVDYGKTPFVVPFIILMALFWNGIMSLFWYMLWIRPFRQKRLFRNGQSAPGTITTHKAKSGRGSTYYLTYEFKPGQGKKIAAQSLVSYTDFQQATDGQAVTIIYNPIKPKRSLIYEFCDFEVPPMVG